jgi:2-aminoethylphosphonate-pyruvate transaminase
MNRSILLNPGPVTLSERVRRALLQTDLCHREPEFALLTLDIKHRLANIYPEAANDYEAILLTGSGTCAVEAMLGSLIPPQGKALIVTNGVYGERMACMVAAHGKPHSIVTCQWHEAMNLQEVENCLVLDPAITHVIAVHHETTTGRLNDVAALGLLCKRYQVALLLDCVSSFGAEEIAFADWNLEACAATANKCLHGVPGVSFVLARRGIFTERPSGASTLYLDLFRYYEEQKQGYSPFTQAVHVYYGLLEALKELEDNGGYLARHCDYKTRSQKIYHGLKELGIEPFLDEEATSYVLRSFKLPSGCSYEEIHDGLKEAGFIIYAGQGGLKNDIFRLANMGDLQMEDINRFLEQFKILLDRNRITRNL